MPRPRHPYSSHETLFGRQRERALLRQCLHDMFAGHGSLILIGGEAGIGKTALVHALIEDAEAEGATVIASACYDLMVTPPYGPWLELLSGFPTPDRTPPLSIVSSPQDTTRTASPDALFAETLDFLVSAASDQPLVLVLEDLHWADAASLELLRYIARQIAGVPLLLIVTYRDTELERQYPLYQSLPPLVREAQATRVNLRPLDTDAMRALTKNRYRLSPPEESRLVRYLQARTEGNPFFIGEILATLEDEGVITQTADRWILGDLGQILVPPLIRQVIEGRLVRLDSRSQSLLAAASVIGQNVSLDVWRAASGATDEDLSAAIKQATELHLLEESEAPTSLRFTHALVRETLYYDLELPQRCKLHQIVGQALADRPSPDPDAVAYHLREAGHDQAPEWMMAAGERAQRFYAWRTAAERFESVLSLLGDDPSYAEARGWLLHRVGLLLTYADPNRGIARLSEAERVANEIDDQHLLAYARADRGLIRCLVGDVRRGLAEMKSGVAALDSLPALDLALPGTNSHTVASRLSTESIQRGTFDLIGTSAKFNIRQGALIFWLAWSGRYSDVIAMGEPYVDQKPDSDAGMQDALGDALAGLGHAYAALGRPDAALNAFARARETYQSIDHHFKVGNTAIYELSEAFLPYRADRVMERQWLAAQAEAG